LLSSSEPTRLGASRKTRPVACLGDGGYTDASAISQTVVSETTGTYRPHGPAVAHHNPCPESMSHRRRPDGSETLEHVGNFIGYARVSTVDQDASLQLDALEAAGCARIFSDTASGALDERPELARTLDHLRAGDTVVVWRLDRLGRSLRHLIDTVGAR